jgi:hypothetical protein
MERASPLCTALRTGSPGSFPRARRALAPAAPGPIGHCIRRHHSILRPRFRHAAPALSPTSSSPHLFPALTRAVRSSRSVPLANINVTPLASRPVPCPSASDPSCAGLPNPPRGNRHSHRTPAAQSQYQRAGRHTHPRGLSLSPRTHALVAPSGLARSPGFARCVTRRRPRHRHAHHVAARRCTPPPPAMAHTPPPAVIQRRPPRRSARRCPHATARHRPQRRRTPLHAAARRHQALGLLGPAPPNFKARPGSGPRRTRIRRRLHSRSRLTQRQLIRFKMVRLCHTLPRALTHATLRVATVTPTACRLPSLGASAQADSLTHVSCPIATHPHPGRSIRTCSRARLRPLCHTPPPSTPPRAPCRRTPLHAAAARHGPHATARRHPHQRTRRLTYVEIKCTYFNSFTY